MHRQSRFSFLTLAASIALSGFSSAQLVNSEILAVVDPADSPNALKVLFFGHQENNHHSPVAVFNELAPVFAADGISLTFTSSLGSITEANLANYDALMMNGNVRSGNTTTNEPLVTIIQKYVRDGGSLIGLHVASAAFRFDPRFAELLGGRFQSHTVGQFTPETLPSNHPLVLELPPLDSFDETYRLKDLNPDIVVLQERVQNGVRLPWTWVRTEGPGRVFYTASGHVPGTGSTVTFDSIIQEAFPDLVQRGTHWATRRHFSSFTISGLLASGKVVGQGSLRTPNTGSYWMSDFQGPGIFAADAQPIILNGETFHFEVTPALEAIPCPDSAESVVFSKNILNDLDESFQGIWLTDQSEVISPIIVEGQPLSVNDPNIITEVLNPEIGNGFAANGSGQLLCRAVLKNENTSALESVIFLSGEGIVIREGETHSSLASGITFSDLSEGLLSLNSSDQFACSVNTSDGEEALARWDGTQLTFPIVKNQAVPGLIDVTWGEILQLKINSTGEVAAIVGLNGTVTSESDSALVRIAASSGSPVIVAREGQALSGSDQLGDLAQANFVMDGDGLCYLVNTLTGALVTSEDDSALLRVGSSIESVIREGDPLPAISSTATMGSELALASLSLDSIGNLYLKANKIEQGNDLETLFRIEGDIVFEVFDEGNQLKRNAGEFFNIASIEGLRSGSDDDGFPSQSSTPDTLATAIVSSSGHRVLIKLDGLNDIDQDGLSNLLDAGLGLSANSSAISQESFPRITELSGELYFTYLRPTQSGLPVPQPQESSNLEDWNPSMGTTTLWLDQSGVPTGFERVGLLITQSDESQFFRLGF